MDVLTERLEFEFGTAWFEPELYAFWIVRNQVAADSIGKIDRLFSVMDKATAGLDRSKYVTVTDVRLAPPTKPEHQEYFLVRMQRSMAEFHSCIVILQTAQGKIQQKGIADQANLTNKLKIFTNPDVAREWVKKHPPG